MGSLRAHAGPPLDGNCVRKGNLIADAELLVGGASARTNAGSAAPAAQGEMGGGGGRLLSAAPLECASYYIEMGELQKAVEILERGRALLWSEMRGLRTPIDRLRAGEGDHATLLAEQFVAISEELERITTTTSAPAAAHASKMDSSLAHGCPEGPGSANDGDDDDYSHPDAFGQMMEKVRVLERARGEIVDQIRVLPGFEDFLTAVPFETLRTAAARGPVIVINHCSYRSDILIVLHDSTTPVLIPTAEDFYARTAGLKESLLVARTEGTLDSERYESSLRLVLEELYELVGRPVIEKLNELGIPEQSRVWWCPTSVFCSLPLHAAGPISRSSEDGVERYVSDVYVSSYTSSLSALIESRKAITDTDIPEERPSLLIVGQPDPSLPGVMQEIKAIRRLARQQPAGASSLIGAKATRASVMEHLPKHRMAHFACHGTLETARPFDTAFLLHGDERLTLLDILRVRSVAEFAFLSVCHAAEWTDERTPDEALHLTAAMQYCGFRSAVGTLWAMADTDGRELSEHFYGRMFGAAEEQGRREWGRPMSIGERSARALRYAVQRLREKEGITLERWVNFVHYGA